MRILLVDNNNTNRHMMAQILHQAFAAQCEDYLVKPIDADKLIYAMERLV